MSTGPEPSSVADAEARAEAARAGLVDTLNQLRENLKPANVAEEVLANAKATASTVTGQVWNVARRNPIPALLIGAGAAMLLGLGQRMSGPYQGADSDDAGGEREPAAPRPPEVLGPERPRSGGQGDDPADATSRADRGQRDAGPSTLAEGQPLLLAALGVAVGAALGAALPRTGPESGAMRGRFNTLREAARRIVQGQADHLKTASSQAVEEIRLTAADHGAPADAPDDTDRMRDPAV